MASHTPGPWRVVDTAQRGFVSVFGGVHDSLVAQAIAGSGLTRADAEANARLIAAAPEMLTTLKAIEALAVGWDDDGALGLHEPMSWETAARIAMDIARAAVAKAEGAV